MGTSATELSRAQAPLKDQRLTLRKAVTTPVRLELMPGCGTWLRDLGEGGLSVSGFSAIDVGASTHARFEFPETGSTINARGVVAWRDETGRVGVRFTYVTPESTLALRRWLRGSAAALSEPAMANDAVDSELASRISCLNEISSLQSLISEQQLDCDAALNLIVQRMAELTRASGAAIALRDGDDVVCRASLGNAPGAGVKLSAGSLSGQCFHTGTTLSLDDSEADQRVNPELCRQLNFRSLLVVPVVSSEEVLGIAEVLSPQPHSFSGGDILVLSFLTDLIASVSHSQVEPDHAPQTNSLPEAFLTQLRGDEVVTDSALEVSEEPAALPPATALPVEAILAISDAPSEEVVTIADVESVSAPLALPVEKPAQVNRLPMLERRLRTAEEKYKTPATLPATSRLVPYAVVAVVVLALLALLSGYYFSRTKKAPSTKPATTVAAVPQPSAVATAAPLNSSATPASSAVTNAPSKSTSANARKSTLEKKPASENTSENTSTELQVTHGSPRPQSIDAVAPDAPALANLDPKNSAALPASLMTTRTAAPELQTTPSQGVTEGKLLKRVMPRYPEMARSAGVSGDVVLSAKIGVDGALHDITVLSGSPLLRQAAIDAAKQWRYSPYLLGGHAVETDTRITINFHR